MPATRVLVLRHGQSVWNAVGRWQGQADPPLSDLGREQAARAALTLGAFDVIVSSDLQRARETAEIIARHHDQPVVVDTGLRERDAGAFSGLTRAEIDERFPGYLTEGRRPPGFEPDGAFLERTLAAMRRVAALAPGGTVLAVAHGGALYMLDDHLGLARGYQANVAGRWFTVDGDELIAGDRVALAGDDAHLRDAPRVL